MRVGVAAAATSPGHRQPPGAQDLRLCRKNQRGTEVAEGLPDMAAPSVNQVSGSRRQVPGRRIPGGPPLTDERGAVMSEYVLLLGAVGLGVAAALVGLGPPLLASFQRSRATLIAPYP